ncbi:hypothetical protein ACIBIZ_52165 [Nonomuraea spiralis]|uniref:hypothetical protein n=1 Tax=Nonomuraea spiralis TaxID=46182 RepID=UPI0037AD15B5
MIDELRRFEHLELGADVAQRLRGPVQAGGDHREPASVGGNRFDLTPLADHPAHLFRRCVNQHDDGL